LQRDRLAELEVWSTVERCERLAREIECHGHHRAGLHAVHVLAGIAVVRDACDARVFEHRDVKLRRFLGLMVEPQARHDFADGRHR
jgi:hypothetical protein